MDAQRIFKFRELEDEPKPFLDHLEELRMMIIKMVVVLGAAMFLAFCFRSEIAQVVQRPLIAVDPTRAENLQSLGVADSMTISFELSFYAGIVMAFPFLLYFLAHFVIPALTAIERRMLFPAAFAGFALFLGGVLFAYFVVLPGALDFFFRDAQAMHWQPTWTVREYYSFATQFIVAFGVAFEMPIAVLVLVKLGLVDANLLRKTRAFAVVIILVFAAVITPTQDMLTLFLMAGPMYVLYEVCILLARFVERKEVPEED